MKQFFLILLSTAFFALTAGNTRQEIYNGLKVYTLENEKLILRICPEKGGKAVSFYLKDRKQELVKFNSDEGFFIDHWAKYQYPSGLMHLRYDCEFVEMKNAVAVKLELLVPEMGGGKGGHRPCAKDPRGDRGARCTNRARRE